MNEVETYYNAQSLSEWERLDHHRTEFAVTLRVMKDYLPPAPAAILDIGGGPGRYAIEMARQGYRVTLADLSDGNLALARQKAAEAGVELAGIYRANALDLPAVLPHDLDNACDAVFLMGPLYHLIERSEREQAVAQALHYLKPGGVLFAAFITRWAPLRVVALTDPTFEHETIPYALHWLNTGQHTWVRKGFTRAYFAHPDEVIPTMESCGLISRDLVGVEGAVASMEDGVNQQQGEPWDTWVEINYRLGHEPSLRGASDHLLYVGIKPG